jgi:DNA-directed RNA polymerase subunit RPC12/RpoP
MKHLDCPHCGKRAITVVRKAFLGPGWPATCRECGKKVGVPYSTTKLVPIVSALTIIGLLAVRSFASFVVVLAGGAALFFFVQILWVPLVPR